MNWGLVKERLTQVCHDLRHAMRVGRRQDLAVPKLPELRHAGRERQLGSGVRMGWRGNGVLALYISEKAHWARDERWEDDPGFPCDADMTIRIIEAENHPPRLWLLVRRLRAETCWLAARAATRNRRLEKRRASFERRYARSIAGLEGRPVEVKPVGPRVKRVRVKRVKRVLEVGPHG